MVGRQGLVDQADAAWWKLWKPAGKHGDFPDTWYKSFDRMKHGVVYKALKAEKLARIARATASDKAVGTDGWSFGLLKIQPLKFWEVVARWFQMIEAEGEWPEAAKGGLVALQPSTLASKRRSAWS